MTILKIYLDTSVIGGCFDDEFAPESQQLLQLIEQKKIVGYCSDVTLQEIQDFQNTEKKNQLLSIAQKMEILKLDQYSLGLSAEYLKEEILSAKSLRDAQHIALASVNNLDVIVSWNFKHIVNFRKIPMFNLVNLKLGHKSIEIRSPKEIVYSYE